MKRVLTSIPKASREAFVGIAFIALGLSGCSVFNHSSSLKISADYLTISGYTLSNGTPVAGVDVYAGNAPAAAIKSGSDGHFVFTLKNADLARFGSSYRLYFYQNQANLAGVSEPIPADARGSRDLGQANLQAAATLKGRVEIVTSNSEGDPAKGANIKVGREAVTVNDDGSFVVPNIAPGAVEVDAALNGYVSRTLSLTLGSGEQRSLAQPIVLFANDAVGGWVAQADSPTSSDEIAAAHPFRRSFDVVASPKAKFIRYSHQNSGFDRPDSSLAWQPLTPNIDYDFPGNGGFSLYFQFADAAKTLVSPVFSATSTVDLFADAKIIQIEDGSGFITHRNVTVHLNLPPTATKMRLASDLSQFADVPPTANIVAASLPAAATTASVTASLSPTLPPALWEVAQSMASYTFPILSQEDCAGEKTLYVQLADAAGNVSAVYQAGVRMELFPTMGNLFTIDGGADTSPDRLVQLTIALPDNAYEMRVFERDDNASTHQSIFNSSSPNPPLPSQIWLPASPTFWYTFHNAGLNTLYVQFRDRDGILSPTYQQNIRILPFPPTPVGFTINGGATDTPTNTVSLDLVPPPGAVSFRVSQDVPFLDPNPPAEAPSTSNPLFGSTNTGPVSPGYAWIPLVAHFPFMIAGAGTHTIYLQYQDLNQDVSYEYSVPIVVDPFPAGSGSFVINNNSFATYSPLLTLSVSPPLAAHDMLIMQDTPPPPPFVGWLPVAPTADYILKTVGVHTIYLKFRTVDGFESPWLQQSVVYDPFPAALCGFSVNGGAATTNIANVSLSVHTPRDGYLARFAADPTSLSGLPFSTITPSMPYQLIERSGLQTIYMQMLTPEGELSPVYTQQINVDLFPAALQVATINGGAASTTTSVVTVGLTPPQAAAYIRAGEDASQLSSHPLLALPSGPNTTINYTLSSGSGLKTIYFQYVTSAQTAGPVFSASITLQ